jgi:hypothetical protein
MVLPLISDASEKLSSDRHEENQTRLVGFDFLRAFFAVVVVAVHCNFFNLLAGKLRLDFLTDILNLNVGSLAVPVFFQISLFLFYLKSERVGSQYFLKKRLPKLIYLYLFWVISKISFNILTTGKSQKIEAETSSIQGFAELVISGGYTIFYFFFSLLFVTFMTEILIRSFRRVNKPSVKTKISYNLLLGSCLLVFSFPIIDITISHCEIFTKITNFLSFLPYVFTTAIVVQEFNEGKLEKMTPSLKLKLWKLFALCLFLIVFEWVMFANISFSSKLFNYSRLSLVFSSWLIMYLTLLSARKPPVVVRFLSGCSLGIYGFHTFFLDSTKFLDALSQVILGLGTVTEFLLALIGSIVLTIILRKIKYLKGFV